MSAHAPAEPHAPAELVSPRPMRRDVDGTPLVRVRVWDRVVRITHWLIFFSMIVLVITGAYIGNPWISAPGQASQSFRMGTMKIVHFYGAIVFTLSVLARIVWMFTGTRHARWPNFVPYQPRRRRGFVETLKFYTFIRRRPPAFEGHNPLAGAAYLVIFGLYLVMILTGLGLYAIGADIDSPMRWFVFLNDWFGSAQTARFIHHIVMWMLIGFFIHHLYSAILVSVVEKNGTLDSIVSGNKWLRPKDLDP